MSDDEHEHEHHEHVFQFALPFQPPPEVIERARMENEANSHETRQFFESLDEAQLKKFGGLIHQVIQTDGHAGSYYIGIAATMLDKKFGVCLGCGKKHDEELAAMTQQPPVSDPVSSIIDEIDGNYECCSEPVGSPHNYECPLIKKYNLEPDDDGSTRVMCKGCAMWYSSLEDRMLRPTGPSGCQGCIEKTKWG